jgi:hypothetical protein
MPKWCGTLTCGSPFQAEVSSKPSPGPKDEKHRRKNANEHLRKMPRRILKGLAILGLVRAF